MTKQFRVCCIMIGFEVSGKSTINRFIHHLLYVAVLSSAIGFVRAQQKIQGVSFVASGMPVLQENIDPLLSIGAGHASIMPFAFCKALDGPLLRYNEEGQWFGETYVGARQYIQELHRNKIEVMLKPQIWVANGAFTGNIKMNNEGDWLVFEERYADFILLFAKLAEEEKVALFCIGTELNKFIESRPQFWDTLIQKVRKVYTGHLTYAANWDEYEETPFWNALDFIGVDAYFPLSEDKNPDFTTLTTGWKEWKDKLYSLHLQCKRPVLFTEYGYRSMDYTAKKPWLVDRNQTGVNLEAQVVAYEAIFDQFWREKWFSGGFLWKWFINHKASGGVGNNRFTPQNKPAEMAIRNFFTKVD